MSHEHRLFGNLIKNTKSTMGCGERDEIKFQIYKNQNSIDLAYHFFYES